MKKVYVLGKHISDEDNYEKELRAIWGVAELTYYGDVTALLDVAKKALEYYGDKAQYYDVDEDIYAIIDYRDKGESIVLNKEPWKLACETLERMKAMENE